MTVVIPLIVLLVMAAAAYYGARGVCRITGDRDWLSKFIGAAGGILFSAGCFLLIFGIIRLLRGVVCA